MPDGTLERATTRTAITRRLTRSDRPILRAHLAAMARRLARSEREVLGQDELALGIFLSRRRAGR